MISETLCGLNAAPTDDDGSPARNGDAPTPHHGHPNYREKILQKH